MMNGWMHIDVREKDKKTKAKYPILEICPSRSVRLRERPFLFNSVAALAVCASSIVLNKRNQKIKRLKKH